MGVNFPTFSEMPTTWKQRFTLGPWTLEAPQLELLKAVAFAVTWRSGAIFFTIWRLILLSKLVTSSGSHQVSTAGYEKYFSHLVSTYSFTTIYPTFRGMSHQVSTGFDGGSGGLFAVVIHIPEAQWGSGNRSDELRKVGLEWLPSSKRTKNYGKLPCY